MAHRQPNFIRASSQVMVLAICLACGAASLRAAPPRVQQSKNDLIGWVPLEILERPVPLRSGIGVIHQQVSTSSPQAQAFYDQGLAYLNSFVWIEAARSFYESLRYDPSLAMSYIGLSDAFIGLQDVQAAHAAYDKARVLALTDKLSKTERAFIVIRGRQLDYIEDSGNLQKYFAYRQAISDALAATPDDPWLWIMRGFADEGTPYAHGQSGKIDAVAFYETALALSPNNFVAHHYLAHTFENLGRKRQALEQSEAYCRLAPAIPHAHHMVGHELMRLGRTSEAVQQFVKADELDNAYSQSENIPAKYDWHYAHNLFLLAMCYEVLGQMKNAETTFRQAFSFPAYTDLAEYNRAAWPQFLLSRGRPQEALEISKALVHSKWALGTVAGYTLTGRALLATGRSDEAQEELSRAEQEIEKLPPAIIAILPDAGVLRATILLQQDKQDAANPLMQQIEQRIVQVPGPDAWIGALFQLESIARDARQYGDWALARSTAEEMIRHDPSYAGGYYALGLADENENHIVAARQAFETARKLWVGCDSDLPELANIRKVLDAQTASFHLQ